VFHFPGGLKDYLEAISGAHARHRDIFAGKSERPGGHGSVEWAITWLAATASSTPTATPCPTPEGGTHEAGPAAGADAGLKAYAN
jgi:topoisomerase-4 subunit B